MDEFAQSLTAPRRLFPLLTNGLTRHGSNHSTDKQLSELTSSLRNTLQSLPNPQSQPAARGDPRWFCIFLSVFSLLQGREGERVTGWVRNSLLSTVKTTLISRVIREKMQRLGVIQGGLGIDQLVFPTRDDPNPAGENITGWY